MTRELLLLRHGKSDWDVRTDDFQRPLKKRGRKGAKQIGYWLGKQQLLPDCILSSPAQRAIDTSTRCCKAMGIDIQQIQQDPRIYLAELETLLQVLADCPVSNQRVMLVGHNPGLEELLLYLCHEPPPLPADGKLLPTATVARLQMPDNWKPLSQHQARLLQLQRAADLH